MIDGARALPMLREAIASWRWQTDSIPAPWVRGAVDGFTNWDNLLDARISDLAGERDQVRALLPRGTSLVETVDAVHVAIENAVKVGVDQGDRDQLARIEKLTEQAKQSDGRVIDRLERELAAALDGGSTGQQARARITVAARDRATEIAGIREFLTEGDHWLTVALKAARMRPRGAGTAADTAVRDLVAQWAAIDEEEQG